MPVEEDLLIGSIWTWGPAGQLSFSQHGQLVPELNDSVIDPTATWKLYPRGDALCAQVCGVAHRIEFGRALDSLLSLRQGDGEVRHGRLLRCQPRLQARINKIRQAAFILNEDADDNTVTYGGSAIPAGARLASDKAELKSVLDKPQSPPPQSPPPKKNTTSDKAAGHGPRGGNAVACPVLKMKYDRKGPHLPRILHCGHTISHGALEDILSQSLTSGGNGSELLCPVCSKVTPIGADGVASIKVNWWIVDLVERQNKINVDEDGNPLPELRTPDQIGKKVEELKAQQRAAADREDYDLAKKLKKEAEETSQKSFL